jgi:SAM-dependent methyltransferase
VTFGECEVCGSLSLLDAIDPAPFYDDYFAHVPRRLPRRDRVWFGVLAERAVLRSGRLGGVIGRLTPRPYWLKWFAGTGVGRHSHIVDLGSGSGAMLLDLYRYGFAHLDGVDPYLPADVTYSAEVGVRRSWDDVAGRPDVITMVHSLEHVDHPLAALQDARDRLAPGGVLVVAVPLLQGPVWEEYRDSWIGLDPPLHRFVPTAAGLERLAQRAGLRVVRRIGESPPHHQLMSELVERQLTPGVDSETAHLAPREIAHHRRRARRLRGFDQCPQGAYVLEVAE